VYRDFPLRYTTRDCAVTFQRRLDQDNWSGSTVFLPPKTDEIKARGGDRSGCRRCRHFPCPRYAIDLRGFHLTEEQELSRIA